MVSEEAKKRAHLAEANDKLEAELKEIKQRLEIEGEVADGLKKRLQVITTRRRSPTVTAEAIATRARRGSVCSKLEVHDKDNEIAYFSSRMKNHFLKTTFCINRRKYLMVCVDMMFTFSEPDDPNRLKVILPDSVSNSNLKDFEEFVMITMKNTGGNASKVTLVGNFGERIMKTDLEPCLRFKVEKGLKLFKVL